MRLALEHQDLYLDNAMALMMQLHGLEGEISGRLRPASSLSVDRWARIDPDFRHRFLDSAMTHAGIRPCREACQLGRRLSG